MRSASLIIIGIGLLSVLVTGCVDRAPVDPGSDAQTAASDAGTPDAEPASDAEAPPARSPVLMIHGINGSSSDYDQMVARFLAAGWRSDELFRLTFDDPSWGCNVDNAVAIALEVQDILARTGASRIHLVAHSMGTLSSRYYIKNLGGQMLVNTYVTLGGMHHGLDSSCSPDFPFKPCIWSEICSSGDFVAQLNADPSTPGELAWVSIYGTADDVVPNSSSYLEGAENIAIPDVGHSGPGGLLDHDQVFDEVDRVLAYPPW